MKNLWICLLFLASSLFAGNSSDYQEVLRSKLKEGASHPIGYIDLPKDRPIDQTTFIYVKRALAHFREIETPFVVLHLDTPGGEVFAALRIVEELLRMDAEYHIPVVAYIDKWALSAGALLAYSCRFIGAASGASMGAAEPVIVDGQGQMQTASEKMVSALRTEFANTAAVYGRNRWIAEAMVDKDIILVEREGKIVKLREESQIREGGKHPDLEITRQGKLLTLNAEQMESFHIADFLVLNPQRSLLEAPFFSSIPGAYFVKYSDWKIDFFAFLSHPLVSSLLMMGLLLGIYGEIQSPGFGFFGSLAILCLGLILLSSFAVDVISWVEVLLLVFGILLFLVDLFWISGFGLLGIVGALLILFGLGGMLLPPIQGFTWDRGQWGIWMEEWFYRLTLFTASILVSLFGMWGLSRYVFTRSFFMRRLVLSSTDLRKEASCDLPIEGSLGESLTALRPFGKVVIHDKVYEAFTEEGWIEPKVAVVVLRKEPGRLVVASKEKSQ